MRSAYITTYITLEFYCESMGQALRFQVWDTISTGPTVISVKIGRSVLVTVIIYGADYTKKGQISGFVEKNRYLSWVGRMFVP